MTYFDLKLAQNPQSAFWHQNKETDKVAWPVLFYINYRICNYKIQFPQFQIRLYILSDGSYRISFFAAALLCIFLSACYH